MECDHKWSLDETVMYETPKSVGNRTFVADVPVSFCKNGCGECCYEQRTLEMLELAIARKLLDEGALKGESLRFCRKSAGMSREQLIDHIAVCGTTYTVEQLKEMEAGRREITPEVVDILKIAVAASAAEATLATGRALPAIR